MKVKKFKNRNIYTIGELKNLSVGDKVILDFIEFDGDSFKNEESEVVLINSDNIYFNNDYGSWDFPLTGNNSDLANQYTGDYEFTVYKK